MKYIKALTILLVGVQLLFAGDVTRKGTTGCDELLIPVGARSIATSGAFVANTVGLEAIYYNPGGLDLQKGSGEAMFSYMSHIADMNLSYFAAAIHNSSLGSVALSIKNLDFGNIPVTTIDVPDGTGATYSPTFMTTCLTYSKVITDRVSAGANVKLLYEKILNTSATGVALDFGVQYKFEDIPLFLGATIKNVGTNMSYSGQDLEYKLKVNDPNNIDIKEITASVTTEEFEIPSYFELAVAYEYNIDESFILNTAVNFRNNNSMEDLINFGLELNYDNNFFLRCGYESYLQNASKDIYSYTLGAGINYEVSRNFLMSFDYAYRPVSQKAFDANHVMTIKLGF